MEEMRGEIGEEQGLERQSGGGRCGGITKKNGIIK